MKTQTVCKDPKIHRAREFRKWDIHQSVGILEAAGALNPLGFRNSADSKDSQPFAICLQLQSHDLPVLSQLRHFRASLKPRIPVLDLSKLIISLKYYVEKKKLKKIMWSESKTDRNSVSQSKNENKALN